MSDLRERVARAIKERVERVGFATHEELAEAAIAAGVGAVPAWLPIETAPKGEDLLVYHLNDDGDPQMDVAFWGKPYGTCWVRGTPWERVYPTHWMPLPGPPAPPETGEA